MISATGMLLSLFLIVQFMLAASRKPCFIPTTTKRSSVWTHDFRRTKVLDQVCVDLRGGGEGRKEDEEEEDDDEEISYESLEENIDHVDDEKGVYARLVTALSKIPVRVLDLTLQVLSFIARLIYKVIMTTTRMIISSVAKTQAMKNLHQIFGRIWNNEPLVDGKGRSTSPLISARSSNVNAKSAGSDNDVVEMSKKLVDMRLSFSEEYGIDTRLGSTQNDPLTPVYCGSLSDALALARSLSRLLVLLIPVANPTIQTSATSDIEAVRSYLSMEVATIAEKKARRIDREPSGSFVLWVAKPESAEAVASLKRLKASMINSKGQKRPVLLVVYPQQVMDRRGKVKIIPRLLAQHHCSPPPSTELMAAWLNALRKRHINQYSKMRVERHEQELHSDRRTGYLESLQSDIQRVDLDRKKLIAKMEQDKAELKHQQEIIMRRQKLQASMEVEPAPGIETVLISFRLADGSSSQRRFRLDSPLSCIFNWVDICFGVERESVTLTTFNGKRSFEWEDANDDTTLAALGFGRTMGLRVSKRTILS